MKLRTFLYPAIGFLLLSSGAFAQPKGGDAAKGKEVFKMEATKVEPGPLPDSLFVPPAGYEKFQMPSLGDMMKGLGGG